MITPRLNSTPVPVPPAYATDLYAGVTARYDLDRVAELAFVEQDLQVEALAARAEAAALPPGRDRARAMKAARLRQFAELVAYCCVGLTAGDGTALPGALDDPASWEAHPRLLLEWIYTRGTAVAAREAVGPFLSATTILTPSLPPMMTTETTPES